MIDIGHIQVCWSDDGERFAGLGDGGVVATWRLDAPRMQASDTGYLGRSDWCHQVSLCMGDEAIHTLCTRYEACPCVRVM